jgi:hypothetical protein
MTLTADDKGMSLTDLRRLEKLEAEIADNAAGMWKRLMIIKKEGLYQQHGTFENYCRVRWNISKTHANRQIQAAGVFENLTPMGVTAPETERQVRPLTGLSPEQQREAWTEAVATAPDGKVTAKHVEEVVKKRIPEVTVELEDGEATTFEKQNAPKKKNGVRGTFDDGSAILETFKQIEESLNELKGLTPKKGMTVEVAGAARRLVAQLERFVSRIEKGH